MPLSVLLPLVVFGIAGIALLLHVLGLSVQRQFRSDDEAIAALHREFPDLTVRSVVLCDRGAILTTDAGPAVVWAMGGDSTARLVAADAIHLTSDTLTIEARDFTAPRLSWPINTTEHSALTAILKGTVA